MTTRSHFACFVRGSDATRPLFGDVLGWEQFDQVAPRGRYEGQPGERRTMFLVDPSGNALEFKSFKHPEHILTA